eukprot:5549669-Prymnesium_polylepis.1
MPWLCEHKVQTSDARRFSFVLSRRANAPPQRATMRAAQVRGTGSKTSPRHAAERAPAPSSEARSVLCIAWGSRHSRAVVCKVWECDRERAGKHQRSGLWPL